jgi:hypothetical protein
MIISGVLVLVGLDVVGVIELLELVGEGVETMEFASRL